MTHREQDIDYFLKQGNTDPSIQSTLTDASGDPIDLRNASGVEFQMRHATHGFVAVDASADILDAVNGVVGYSWSDGDTDTTGLYYGEWVVTYSDGSVGSIPNDGFIQLYISPGVN